MSTRRLSCPLHELARRRSALLAALFALAAALAAPYLAPADPDSAVFRSGTLGAILLLATFFPVRTALERHSARALLYGSAFALIFSFFLSIGSELTFYGQLLPGAGSLLRRLAVPLMVTPMLGSLCSFLFREAPSGERRPARLHIPYAAFLLLLAACYAAVLLAFYPGVVAYDFEHEIAQYQSGVYNAAHPVFHTLFLGTLYRLGEAFFGSMTAGAATYSAVQLLLLAAMYAAALDFLQSRVPLPVTLLLTVAFALLPFHSVMAISTAKDPLFSGLIVLLCILLWSALEAPGRFLKSRRHITGFVAVCLLLCLLRHNALFAVLPACIAVILLCRSARGRAAILVLATLALCTGVPKGLETLLHAEKTPSSELMSVPCQQLMRTAAVAPLSQEEYDEISPWFSDAIHRYRPYCADPAKGGNFDFERYSANPSAFWEMFLRYGRAYPRVYLEAFLLNCAGLWNPDDASHYSALAGEEYDFVYLITAYYYEDGRYDIHPHSLLPGLRSFLYNFTHHAKQKNTPLLAQACCPAAYTYLLLFATMLLFFRRERRLALSLLPLWGLLLSLLFSAGIFVRYAYPLMSAVPVLLALILFAKRPDSAA